MPAPTFRLLAISQEGDEAWLRRLAAAREEIGHVREYDYAIINDSLDQALQDLRCIVLAERLRTSRQLARHHDLASPFCMKRVTP